MKMKQNHNRAAGVRVRTRVKAGATSLQHNRVAHRL
jgi:hypothetical protein